MIKIHFIMLVLLFCASNMTLGSQMNTQQTQQDFYGELERFTSRACGLVSQIRETQYPERQIMNQSLCLVKKLLPKRTPVYRINWSALRFARASKSCLGLTRYGSFGSSTKVYIFTNYVSLPKMGRQLTSYYRLGSTLVHEFHHYHTRSRHDGSRNDPTVIYDDTLHEAMMSAITNKNTTRDTCRINGTPGEGQIRNKLKEYACECKIPFWES